MPLTLNLTKRGPLTISEKVSKKYAGHTVDNVHVNLKYNRAEFHAKVAESPTFVDSMYKKWAGSFVGPAKQKAINDYINEQEGIVKSGRGKKSSIDMDDLFA